jgi:hypothetical protein
MRVRSLLAAAVAAVVLILTAAPALAAGSLPATQGNGQAPTVPLLVAVRTAHHPGFDRITFEFRGPLPSHRVGYVSRSVEDASGEPVHLAGRAAIEVVFQGANAHDEDGQPTVSPRRLEPGLPSLKEVAQVGDFEAVVSYGLGVDHRVPFKVLELRGPSRIAIDLTTGGSPGGTASGTSGTPSGSDAQGRGALPFTGSQTTALLLEGLGVLAIGLLVITLARKTRTP